MLLGVNIVVLLAAQPVYTRGRYNTLISVVIQRDLLLCFSTENLRFMSLIQPNLISQMLLNSSQVNSPWGSSHRALIMLLVFLALFKLLLHWWRERSEICHIFSQLVHKLSCKSPTLPVHLPSEVLILFWVSGKS